MTSLPKMPVESLQSTVEGGRLGFQGPLASYQVVFISNAPAGPDEPLC